MLPAGNNGTSFCSNYSDLWGPLAELGRKVAAEVESSDEVTTPEVQSSGLDRLSSKSCELLAADCDLPRLQPQCSKCSSDSPWSL